MTNGIIIWCILLLCKESSLSHYCMLCKNNIHTMCKYKNDEPSKLCLNYTSNAITAEIQDTIVSAHNELRNRIALGKENRGNPGPQPSSSNMKALKWDEELCVIAQRWANQCISALETNQHDECKITDKFNVGQNIFQIAANKQIFNFKQFVQSAIKWWYNEVHLLNLSHIKSFHNTESLDKQIGHYSQMIWATTEYLGCAHVAFMENVPKLGMVVIHRLICNYGPSGNIIGLPIYRMGNPCQECKCFHIKYRGLCYDENYDQKIMPLYNRNLEKFGNKSVVRRDDPTIDEHIKKLLPLFEKYNLTITNNVLKQISELPESVNIADYIKDLEEHLKEASYQTTHHPKLHQSLRRTTYHPKLHQSLRRTTHQSTDQTLHQSTEQTLHQSTYQSTDQALNQTTQQTIDENETLNDETNELKIDLLEYIDIESSTESEKKITYKTINETRNTNGDNCICFFQQF